MLTIDVIEHKDGSLTVTNEEGKIDLILPNYNLDLSLDLLVEFNKLYSSEKFNLDYYSYKNYFILPAIQEYIYWDYFVPIVKYKEFFEKYDVSKVAYNRGNCNFGGGIGLDKYFKLVNKKTTILSRFIHNSLVFIREILQPCVDSVLFYDDGADGFRYKKVKEALLAIQNFCRIDFQLRSGIFKQFKYKKCFPYGYRKLIYGKNNLNLNLNSELSYLNKCRYGDFTKVVDEKCQDIIAAAEKYERKLRNKKIKLIITYDQIEAINPLVIAAKLNKIKVVSYQHGILTKYHAGWIAPGIESSLCNLKPDYIIVWGDYWKSKLASYSNKYTSNNIIIGCHPNKSITINNKLFLKRSDTTESDDIHVLYPYEFMANHISIAKFFEIFISHKVKLTIKIRPSSFSDPASGDLACDMLSYPKSISDNISFVHELPSNDFDDFDIVLCSQSTFAYEAIQFGKTIWYMDTDFTFIDSIFKDKIAHKITLDNLENILTNRHLNNSFYYPRYDLDLARDIFSQNNINTVLKDIIELGN